MTTAKIAITNNPPIRDTATQVAQNTPPDDGEAKQESCIIKKKLFH